MSYPPRPPMPPFMNPSIPPPHMMPSMTPNVRSYRNSAIISSQPTVYQRTADPVPQFRGPIITVFVGNISERVPEGLIKRILSTCGVVINWKRVSTFGFCEYDGPTAGMRAVRLLSEMEIDGKKLVAKVDAKNKLLLDNYKEEEMKNGINETINEKTDDDIAINQMRKMLDDHKHEFDEFDANAQGNMYGSRAIKTKPNRPDDHKVGKVLNETNLEEEKRNLISSEIGKFRKRAEADEHKKEKEKEKEKDRKKRDDKEREKPKDGDGSESEQDWDIDEHDESIVTGNNSGGASNRKEPSIELQSPARKDKDRESRHRSRERDDEEQERKRRREEVHDRSREPIHRSRDKDDDEVVRTRSRREDVHARSRERVHRSRDRDDEEVERKRRREEVHDRSERSRERIHRSRDRDEEDQDRKRRDHDRGREPPVWASDGNNVRERERERERDDKTVKNIRDVQRDKEMEEELRERKKTEKKAREKEEAYQERLINWELREKRKTKEYEKFRNKENIKLEEREKEAKRLKEFVEDYDDDRDDVKYYKGRELQRRLAERVREADLDAKDRNKEQEELEELKNKIFSGEYENPTQEYERARKEHEKLYKPQILIDVKLENLQRKEREQERIKEKLQAIEKRRRSIQDIYANDEPRTMIKTESIESISNDDAASRPDSVSNVSSRYSRDESESRDYESNPNIQEGDSVSSAPSQTFNNSKAQNNDSASTPPMPTPVISLNLGANAKKKKIEITGVFNNDEDNDDANNTKKRKLVPLDYDDNQLKAAAASAPHANERHGGSASGGGSGGKPIPKKHSKNDAANAEAANIKKDDNSSRVHDEKRRHIKSIIDRIPTQKEDLFNYKLDRNEIDNSLMERKIRPWINKKIIEYIGEPEPTLVDFICSKVLAGSSPQSILDDVQMVLDEEAEVFVVKMWRLLIYEVDAKKIGLGK